jgi:outer membrane protein OmpA-like peptidoglycan-associated protein
MKATHKTQNPGRSLIAIAVASILLAACAAAPVKPSGAEEARAKLTQLQRNPDLASKAPAAIAEAEFAVQAAEQPQTDRDLGQYRVYIADRKVDIAKAQAQTRYLEDQRAVLEAQRQSARLDSRTREADAATEQMHRARADDAAQKLIASQAQVQADAATAQANQARSDANQARSDADATNVAAAASAQQSAQQAADLQHQIDTLNARVTERGLVLTLGDVLFTTGKSDLKSGSAAHLDRLVAFLIRYPSREVMIEGYTDSVGSEEYNQGLSERRAESVRHYLTGQGIDAARLSASGKGESNPVSGNDSATGRQQNRRVEVIISNPAIASR